MISDSQNPDETPDNCLGCGTPTVGRIDGNPACDDCQLLLSGSGVESDPALVTDGGTVTDDSAGSGPSQLTISDCAAAIAPIDTGLLSAECPLCHRRIGESRRPRSVPTDRFRSAALRAADSVPVWSFQCDECELLLVIDPGVTSAPAAAPDSPGNWIASEIATDRGTRVPALVVPPESPGGFDSGGVDS